MTPSLRKPTPGRRGRPRRLTLDAIVDTACDLPAGNLDMASIASRLKVGGATLYGYVEGREHLLRLVAERKGQLQPIVDHGQSWQDILREHARSTCQTALDWPELVSQIMQGGVFGDVEAQYLEQLIALLGSRGFTPGRALELYYAVNQLVLGAAVTGNYLKAVAGDGGHAAVLSRFVHSQPEGALPLLQRALADNPQPAVLGDFNTALEHLLAGCQPDNPGNSPSGRSK